MQTIVDSSRHLRVKTVLHARVWGVDANSLPFMHVATIRDISDAAIVVDGLICPLKKGAALDVQYNGSKAEFLVQWVEKREDGTAGLIGLQQISSEPCIWDAFLERACGAAANG